jgi:glycosyltransferase involved in cell wall biosynthesis
MKQRILMVTPRYPPARGGAELYAQSICDNLKQDDFTVLTTTSLSNKDIASFQFSWPFFRRAEYQGFAVGETVSGRVRIRRLPVSYRLYSYLRIPGLRTALREELATGSYALVHALGYHHYTNLVACQEARRAGVPFILTGIDVVMPTHLPLAARLGKRVYDRLFGRRLLAMSTRVVAISESQVDELVRLGAAKERVSVVTPAIDLAPYKNVKPGKDFRATRALEGRKVFLFIGRLEEHKGVQDVLRIIPEIADPKFLFVIIGPPHGYAQALKKMVGDLGVAERVRFVHDADEQEKISYLKSAEALLLPSRMEGFGIVLVEAMACGTPCIVYDLAPMNEIVADGVTGYVEKDAEGIRRRIVELLKRRNPLSMAAIVKSAERYAQERFIRAYDKLYSERKEEKP